ncbi:hypothetical protein VN97_g5366 [Penicillium thymicola]|uniref:Uncharacterized protein n=1 Tax=Penicillium thymicola TaxID=293382 RepID=A0AAI9TIM5_PENTH|nr:hypothetical protein VN97_g5366 [Penicillium thymicola]
MRLHTAAKFRQRVYLEIHRSLKKRNVWLHLMIANALSRVAWILHVTSPRQLLIGHDAATCCSLQTGNRDGSLHLCRDHSSGHTYTDQDWLVRGEAEADPMHGA